MVSQFNDRKLSTDFWWLSSEEARQYGYVDLFHQEPYSDEPKTDREPLSCPMLKSRMRHPLEDIYEWKTKFRNTNVFRDYALYNSDIKGEEIIGPFLIDIDRTLESTYQPDLEKALADTRLLVNRYCSNLQEEDYRVFFTGHKGFHIEINPRVLSLSSSIDRKSQFIKMLRGINKQLGHAFVDIFHDHIRLHNSINSWIDHLGQQLYYMNYRISADELFNRSIKDISIEAEKLALAEDKANGHIS